MKLTNEDIKLILEEYNGDPKSKANKLRLLAAFVAKVGPMVGISADGDVVDDLMQWADEAHLEECEFCSKFEREGLAALFSGAPNA